jgi:uncharacterized membrane protein
MSKVFKVRKIMDYKFAKTLIYVKGLFGVFELIFGLILLFSGPKLLNKYTVWILDFEPFQNPNMLMDYTTQFMANYVLGSMHILITSYLIAHGVVFILVVIALVHKKLWAFPTAAILLMGFILYQIYTLAIAFSVILSIFTILDLLIIFFLRYEYKRVIKELDI